MDGKCVRVGNSNNYHIEGGPSNGNPCIIVDSSIHGDSLTREGSFYLLLVSIIAFIILFLIIKKNSPYSQKHTWAKILLVILAFIVCLFILLAIGSLLVIVVGPPPTF